MKKIVTFIFALTLLSSNSFADITFWTTEVQPARMEKQMEMAKSFESKTGIKVEVIPVEEKDLGSRATAAAAAGNLPDVIYHTLQYVLPWAEAGILDVNANNDVVKSLGKKTFAPGALNMAKKGGKIAAVPVDGWTQMVVYRKDLFKKAGLEPPTSYENIEKAVKDLKHGQVIFKAEQQGIIQGTIANSSMDNTQITENLNSFIAELQRLKPASSKGIYLKDIYLSTSMGPGYKIDVSQF